MGKKTKLAKDRLDKYYHLAKERGYRSRAAFKLIQLNKKYEFLNKAKCVVDICAAPGGWLQIARQICPNTTTLYGVDLDEIKPIPKTTTFVGDITLPRTLRLLKNFMGADRADVVLHDGAPNVGTNWTHDAYTQVELVVHSLKMACDIMTPGAWFITKVFRSKEYMTLIWLFKQLFGHVEATKPKASRATSAEIYIVCSGYKAPKEIDPKMFDPAFVFQDNADTFEQVNLKQELAWRKGKRKRNRSGYEDGDLVLYKRNSVKEFIDTQRPIQFLVKYSVIEFDEQSKPYLEHPSTSQEIKILLSDTKVMGRRDFKEVLKWRQEMINHRDQLERDTKMEDVQEIEDDSEEESVDIEADKIETLEDLQHEMEKIRKRTERKKKRMEQKKRIKEAKRPKTAHELMEHQTDIMDNIVEDHLFSLSSLHDKEMLQKAIEMNSANQMLDEDIAMKEKNDLPQKRKRRDDEEFMDVEEQREVFDTNVEENLDALYDQYKSSVSRHRRKFLEQLKHVDSAERSRLFKEIKAEASELLGSGNPLLVDLPDDEEKLSGKKLTKAWYSQNIFDALREEDHEQDAPARKRRRLESSDESVLKEDVKGGASGASTTVSSSVLDPSTFADDGYSSEESGDDDENDYDSDDIDSDDELPEELNDLTTRATTLAIAKKMLRKKTRREFIDSAYNRYAFNDTDNLPDWFQDEARVVYRPNIPVTKEEIQQERIRLAELNAKPIKAKLEAEFRRKRKLAKNRKGVIEKAQSVAESREMTNAQKERELNRLYREAKGKQKLKKIYVTPGQSRPKKGKDSVIKRVDRRMKADKRGEKKKR